MIPVYKPYLPPHFTKYAHEALESNWIGSIGEYKIKLAEYLQELLGVKHILLTNNGTTACHLMAKALDYKCPQVDSIVCSNNSYIAAWNGFLFDKGRYTLKPLDANINTWNLDTTLLQPTDKAVLIVHNVGNIVNVPRLQTQFPNTIFLEDNCEGFLGKYNNRYSGTSSFCSAISFHSAKTITVGEGGAVITNDDDTYQYLDKIHGQGQSSIKYIHDILGYNYRMTNIAAALVYGQMIHLQEIVDRKEFVFSSYRKAFEGIENIQIQEVEKGTSPANWFMGIRVIGSSYKQAEGYFKDKNIEIRPMFYPMSVHEHLYNYANKEKETVACQLSKECFFLPSFPELMVAELVYIIEMVKQYVATIR